MQTMYIVSESRTNVDNAITKHFGSFFMAFEVEKTTGLIISFGCTHTLKITEDFLSKIFVGKNLVDDLDEMKKEIQESYFGSSAKAITVALADINKRYVNLMKK